MTRVAVSDLTERCRKNALRPPDILDLPTWYASERSYSVNINEGPSVCAYLPEKRPHHLPRHHFPVFSVINSNELWEFDPMTKIWTEVIVGGQSPAGRDGHTASAFGSKIIVFGGRGNVSTSGQETSLLGDVWEIDLDPNLMASVATHAPTVSRL